MRGCVADLAEAIAYIDARPERYHVGGPIVVMGIGTGAGAAALPGSDQTIFEGAHLPFARLKAVVAVNGVAYDGPASIAADPTHQRTLRRVFGADEAAQRANSAVGHVAPPNAPLFYFLNSTERQMGQTESTDFATALRRNGTSASTGTMDDPDASIPQRTFGDRQHSASAALRALVIAQLR